ncbi:MAG: nucleotidyltransferase family protein [Candidatus Aminicenantes bacterium]|nr:nucleotidyltransferase family protein [Candidatus Aminicenantes bacterium]
MTIPEIKNRIIPVLKKYGIKKAALFGSIVKGENTKDSDIDILVEMPETATLLESASLKIELEEILKKNVDVLTYDSLHHLLKDKILHEQEAVL